MFYYVQTCGHYLKLIANDALNEYVVTPVSFIFHTNLNEKKKNVEAKTDT